MKNPLTLFCDDTGAYSMMRVSMFLMIVAIIASKFINAYLFQQPVVWSGTDWGLIVTVFSGKVIQAKIENSPSTPSIQ